MFPVEDEAEIGEGLGRGGTAVPDAAAALPADVGVVAVTGADDIDGDGDDDEDAISANLALEDLKNPERDLEKEILLLFGGGVNREAADSAME